MPIASSYWKGGDQEVFCFVVERRVWRGTLLFAAAVVLMAGVYVGVEKAGGFQWAQGGRGWSRHIFRSGSSPVENSSEARLQAVPALAPGDAASVAAETGAPLEGLSLSSLETGQLAGEPVPRGGEEEEWGTLPPEVRISLDAWAREQAEGAQGTADGSAAAFDLYEEYRLERDRLHARQMEALERAMNDPEVAEAKRWESHQRMLDMLASREREVELEYMLRARGYTDAVVAVREDYANVVVDGLLEEHDAARIGELVVRVAGVPIERIAIVDGYQGP